MDKITETAKKVADFARDTTTKIAHDASEAIQHSKEQIDALAKQASGKAEQVHGAAKSDTLEQVHGKKEELEGKAKESISDIKNQ